MARPLSERRIKTLRRAVLASARPHLGTGGCPVCLNEAAPQRSFCAKDARHGLCRPCAKSVVTAAGKRGAPPRCPMCRDVLAGVPRYPTAVVDDDDGKFVPGELLEDEYMCCLKPTPKLGGVAARRALLRDAARLVAEDDGMQEEADIPLQGVILNLLFETRRGDIGAREIDGLFARLTAYAAHEALLRWLREALAVGGGVKRYEAPCFSYSRGDLSSHPRFVRYVWAACRPGAEPFRLDVFTAREYEGSADFRPYYAMSPTG